LADGDDVAANVGACAVAGSHGVMLIETRPVVLEPGHAGPG
jgi:hypothetical protein